MFPLDARETENARMEKESLELLLGQGFSVAQIGARFGKDPSTISYWMEKYGLAAPNRDKHAAKGGIPREVLEPLVAAGRSIAEIAAQLKLSKGTVRHWLRRYDLRTQNVAGRRPGSVVNQAKDEGRLNITMECRRHGETSFYLEQRGYYRCKRCRSEAVARRRRKMRSILVAEAGGRCCVCGYDRSVAALEFHHLDRSQKRMSVSARGIAYALDTVRAEAAKCILLCANCHVEVENGLIELPIK
jgi:transposase